MASLMCAALDGRAAATALQAPGASFLAFEAENAQLISGTPENWIIKDDAAASGGKTLIIAGNNSTGDSPHSFAQFRMKFMTAGTYYIYYRWQAEPARTAGDVFTANSIWIGNRFGAFSTPGAAAQADYVRSDSNNLNAPENSVYTWRRAVASLVYTVGDAEINGGAVTLTMGTREAGFTLDRIVLSTDGALTPAALDALLNSETDLIVQGAGETFVAWEAEVKGNLIAGTPENWVVKQDAAASGGATLIIAGSNSTGDSPHSFAQFRIKFATAGTYYIYYRWQAEPARTAGDVFTGNSIWIANRFGEFSTPGAAAQTDYIRSDSNNLNAPENSVYTWRRDVESLVYTVGDAEISADAVALTMGTREAGFTLDRIVLSTDGALTPAALDALLNSGSKPVAPEIKSAVASGSLIDVRLVFSRPIDPATAEAGDFSIGGLAVNTVQVSAEDGRIVNLVTAAQTPGTQYTINITGVKDTTGVSIAPGANIRFTAWKKVPGWATKEIYLGVVGGAVSALQADADFIARKPDRVEFVRGFQINNDPLSDNYGSLLSALFKPETSGIYDFYPRNDDELSLLFNSAGTAEASAEIGLFPLQATIDEGVTAASEALVGGQEYSIVALLQQAGGDVYLNVAARRQGDATPLSALELVGNRIATYVNPDLGVITFGAQPGNVTTTAGNRARFEVKVNALTRPIYYQWQRNGSDIPGAIRPVYYTPVLSTADSGATFRCMVSVAGTDTLSNPGTLTVNAGSPSPLQPYVGVNFVGGGTAGGGALLAQDVAGVILQENWNNLTGFAFDNAPLNNASGAVSPVTLSVAGATEVWYTGANAIPDANGLLMQGFINAVSATEPVVVTLGNVPAGNYMLLAYTMGFDFSADYRESFELTGASAYPTLHVRGETGLVYAGSPSFRRARGTNPDARETGNYVQFENVSPAVDGTLTLAVAWEGELPGNTHQPAINALQLVRINTTTELRVSAVVVGGQIEIHWPEGTLESSSVVNGGWATEPGAVAPSYRFTPAAGGGAKFFRAKK